MADPPTNGGVPDASMVQLEGPFPPELWDIVLSKADSRTLKAARRVNSAFKALATPHLFDHVVFSVDEKIQKNLRSLAKDKDLSKHVRRLYLDTTSYREGLDTTRYSQLTASYFQTTFDLPRQPNTSPLSEKSLLRVLRSDPVEDLGLHCLSGAARKSYITGYATYLGRSDYYREQLQTDGIHKQLKDLLPKFSNLKHVETITLWTAVDNSRARFADYLRRTQPEPTLKAISGLPNAAAPSTTKARPAASFPSAYCAPGQTSRRLNPLTPPPNFNGCWGDSTVFELLTAALRALNQCKPKLESLSLPGGDGLDEYMPLRDRIGIIPLPALLTVPRGAAASTKTLLLPLFEGLKKLELKLDFAHPGTQNTFRHHMDPSRLCAALQKMPVLERLSLGALDYPDDAQANPWSIYETLLRSKEDKDILPEWDGPDAEDDDEDDFNGALGGLAGLTGDLGHVNIPVGVGVGVQGITLAMLAASMGIAPPPPAQGGPPPGPPPATTAPAQGAPAAPNPTNAPAAPAPSTTPPADPTPKIHPSTPLKPNPWPKLKHLTLFYMPGTKEDFYRLIRTVASSGTLETLNLHKVYLDDRLQTRNGTVSSPTSPPSYRYENIGPHWLEVIDLIADELRTLKSATVTLSDRDTDYMFDLLAEKIEGYDDIAFGLDIDDMIGDYVLGDDARGTGFATYVRNLVKDVQDEDEDGGERAWEDEDEEEDDDDEDASESDGTDDDMPDLI